MIRFLWPLAATALIPSLATRTAAQVRPNIVVIVG